MCLKFRGNQYLKINVSLNINFIENIKHIMARFFCVFKSMTPYWAEKSYVKTFRISSCNNAIFTMGPRFWNIKVQFCSSTDKTIPPRNVSPQNVSSAKRFTINVSSHYVSPYNVVGFSEKTFCKKKML